MYDGLTLVQELSGATPTANLLTGLGIDETFLRTDSAGTRTFLTDGLGSTMALADSTGTLVTQYTYDPFGKTTVTGTASTNAGKFTGREDDGTGLYYYRARYYHPGLQRFISQDPIGFGGGDVNLYAYVGNDPVNHIDPDGRLWWLLPWAGPYIAAAAETGFQAALIVGSAAGAAALIHSVGEAFPREPLPRNEHGIPIPETPDAAHTQLGWRDGSKGPYPQAREFDENGRPVRDFDFTDHGRPRNHPNPHQHPYDPKTGKRGGSEPCS